MPTAEYGRDEPQPMKTVRLRKGRNAYGSASAAAASKEITLDFGPLRPAGSRDSEGEAMFRAATRLGRESGG